MTEVEQAVSEYAEGMQKLHLLLDKKYPLRREIPAFNFIPEESFNDKELQEARAKVDQTLEKWRALVGS